MGGTITDMLGDFYVSIITGRLESSFTGVLQAAWEHSIQSVL